MRQRAQNLYLATTSVLPVTRRPSELQIISNANTPASPYFKLVNHLLGRAASSPAVRGLEASASTRSVKDNAAEFSSAMLQHMNIVWQPYSFFLRDPFS